MTNGQPELLTGLSQDEVDAILALGTKHTLCHGWELFHLGDVADSIYLVLRGRIRLTLPMAVRGQDEDVLVEERRPGETVGWSALTPPYRFTLTAKAPLDTQVIALPREALLEYFEAHPAVGRLVLLNLAAVIGHRLQLFQAMWLREMQRTVEQHSV
jgi:CRP/FNR family transcriptional regulator, cyclic AMP receptor protein